MNKIIERDLSEITSPNLNLNWSYFSGKTVLITGASGMLASYLVMTLLYLNRKKILKNPVKVIGLVRNIEYAMDKFSTINDDSFSLVKQDLNDSINLSSGIDIIIHTASQASPKFYGTDPVGTMVPNIIGTKNLLDLAKEKKVEKFLFFSSGEVYGSQDSLVSEIKENSYGKIDFLDVRSCYSVSKIAGETLCISYGHQYGINVSIVRPFHTYGPGMKLDDGRVFADFVSNIVNNENIVMRSDGLQQRLFCYISDATTGFFYVLLKGRSCVAYNVANPHQNVSIRKLADTLVGLFPSKDLEVTIGSQPKGGYLRSNIISQHPSIDRLMGLGWKPNINIEEGFRRTIKNYL